MTSRGNGIMTTDLQELNKRQLENINKYLDVLLLINHRVKLEDRMCTRALMGTFMNLGLLGYAI